MEKNLYIDASHPEETRVVLKSKSHIEEYEYENKNSLNQKSNIYLGKISRVEPSLQAAFVNYGRERHGFLAFNDIQSDYYQIPTEDKEVLKKAEEKIREDLKEESQDSEAKIKSTSEEEINVNSSSNINQENKITSTENIEKNIPEKGPLNFIVGSLTSFLLFIFFYFLSNKIAIYFSVHKPSNSSEIVQNISSSINTLIIGLSFLLTFSFAFIGIGLFIVFIRSFIVKKS